MGALAVSMLSACHNHDHEEEHAHGTEETAREDNHEEHADEIILTAFPLWVKCLGGMCNNRMCRADKKTDWNLRWYTVM